MKSRRGDGGAARYVLLIVGLVGEFAFGGPIFGFNALSLVVRDMQYYAKDCHYSQKYLRGADEADATDLCSSQDSKLAVVWMAGTLAVNFGPALAGPALDYLGPRIVATAGALLSTLGFVLMGGGSCHCAQCKLKRHAGRRACNRGSAS
jgi:hypothetical protein